MFFAECGREDRIFLWLTMSKNIIAKTIPLERTGYSFECENQFML